MTSRTQSIIFCDQRKPIPHVEPGMVEPILNMTYLRNFLAQGDYLFFRSEGKSEGEFDVILAKEEGDVKVATVVNDVDSIETIKEVKTLGNSVAIAISNECKMLDISPGDRIRVRIEKLSGCDEDETR